jgi:hypothetical protein
MAHDRCLGGNDGLTSMVSTLTGLVGGGIGGALVTAVVGMIKKGTA